MTELNKLLDKARETRSLNSDAALATELGLKRQSVFQWRQGGAIGDEPLAALIALADAPAAAAVTVHREQAKSATERALWTQLARQLGAAAAIGAVALFASIGGPLIAFATKAYSVAMPIM